MKKTYQKKLTLSFLAIFTLFTIGIIIFEQQRSKMYKTEALEEKLDAYSELINNYIGNGTPKDSDWYVLNNILPHNLRITLISNTGKVTYDNVLSESMQMENHAERPEILNARQKGKGSDIRTSVSNSQPYLYYAKYFGNGFIRVALPYNIEVKHFLKPDNGSLYFILALFIIGLLVIHYIGGRFGNSIRQLRDFSLEISDGKNDINIPDFPKDELGEIGEQLVKDYQQLKENENKLLLEKEKLLQHVHSSAEGICFFGPDKSIEFYNGLFLQYLNIINDKDNVEDESDILSIGPLKPALDFLASSIDENYFETIICRNGREFLLRLNKFEDKSFEIVLNDITSQKKTTQLKKEMTGNIAHELRTPVTSIRGFLETVLNIPMEKEKQDKFIRKAYSQTLTLSELISDMGLLTKIEGNPGVFDFKEINLSTLFDKILFELKTELAESEITINNLLAAGLIIKGNESLVYSIFRNLTDNVIKHAGKKVTVTLKEINTKDGFVYLSYGDTGRGIEDDSHLNRLFERFYRADEGRTRDIGGSGLGLSIVKNAVIIHKGSIHVKRHESGGLEFIISLPLTK